MRQHFNVLGSKGLVTRYRVPILTDTVAKLAMQEKCLELALTCACSKDSHVAVTSWQCAR